MFRLSVLNESFLPEKIIIIIIIIKQQNKTTKLKTKQNKKQKNKKNKNKKPQQGLYSIYLPMPQTEHVSATGSKRIKLNLCTRIKSIQNSLKIYSSNSSFIFMLKVCLESTYFTETKIF